MEAQSLILKILQFDSPRDADIQHCGHCLATVLMAGVGSFPSYGIDSPMRAQAPNFKGWNPPPFQPSSRQQVRAFPSASKPHPFPPSSRQHNCLFHFEPFRIFWIPFASLLILLWVHLASLGGSRGVGPSVLTESLNFGSQFGTLLTHLFLLRWYGNPCTNLC